MKSRILKIVIYMLLYGIVSYLFALSFLSLWKLSLAKGYATLGIQKLPMFFIIGLVYLVTSQLLLGKKSPDGKI